MISGTIGFLRQENTNNCARCCRGEDIYIIRRTIILSASAAMARAVRTILSKRPQCSLLMCLTMARFRKTGSDTGFSQPTLSTIMVGA